MDDAPPLLRDPRYRSLDLWRGVACLMVVVHHAGFIVDYRDLKEGMPDLAWRTFVVGFFKQMELGVPLFFVISGYCIAASADATRRKARSPWTFLARRLHRIYPPYWAALALFVAFCGGLDLLGLSRFHQSDHALELLSPDKLNAAQWLGNITLTETWRHHIGGGYEQIYTRVAWSLCYEEQFYLVCFLCLLLAPRHLYRALAVSTALILFVRVISWDTGWITRFSGTFIILWHEFAIGLAVYHRLNVAATPIARRLTELAIVALFGVAIATGYKATAVAAGFGLLLILLRGWDDRLESAPVLRPMYACGRRCYSIYLAHLPVCVLGNLVLFEWGIRSFWGRVFVIAPVVSAAAVAFCWGFFALVERHFLNTPVAGRPVAVTTLEADAW